MYAATGSRNHKTVINLTSCAYRLTRPNFRLFFVIKLITAAKMLSKKLVTASFAVCAIATTTTTTTTDAAEYDYVIVGSGPGGGSLA